MANKTLYQQMRKYKKEIFQISIYFKISPAFVQPAKIRQLRSRRAIKYRFQAGIFILWIVLYLFASSKTPRKNPVSSEHNSWLAICVCVKTLRWTQDAGLIWHPYYLTRYKCYPMCGSKQHLILRNWQFWQW